MRGTLTDARQRLPSRRNLAASELPKTSGCVSSPGPWRSPWGTRSRASGAAGARGARPSGSPARQRWRRRLRSACAARRRPADARRPDPVSRPRRPPGRAGRPHAAARSGAGRRARRPTTRWRSKRSSSAAPRRPGAARAWSSTSPPSTGAPARGTLALAVASGWPDFGPGEAIACRARLRALRGTRNPGLPDPALALRAVGIDALAGVPTAGAIRRLAEPAGLGPRRAAYLARRALRNAIDRAVGGRGRRLPQDRGARRSARRLAGGRGRVSRRRRHPRPVRLGAPPGGGGGAVLSAGARGRGARSRGCRSTSIRAPSRPPPRCRRSRFFTLLTGEAVATERSALMLALGMGALLVGRAASPAPTIAGAALILLLARPLQIFDVSLQLSVASVAGIALCARRVGAAAGAPAATRSGGGAGAGSGASAPRRWPRRPPPRRSARTSSARWRRWRRSATWRWCRWSRWRSSRWAWPAPPPAAIWAPLGRWPLRPGRGRRAADAGDRRRLPRCTRRSGSAAPRTPSRRLLLIAAGALALLAVSAPARGRRRLLASRGAGCGARRRLQPRRPRAPAAVHRHADRDLPGRRSGGRRGRRGAGRRGHADRRRRHARRTRSTPARASSSRSCARAGSPASTSSRSPTPTRIT